VLIVIIARVAIIALTVLIALGVRIAKIVPDCPAALVGSITRLRMTVKELREFLANFPDDIKVLVVNEEYETHVDVDVEYSKFYNAIVFSEN
jgi:hypothetical protein